MSYLEWILFGPGKRIEELKIQRKGEGQGKQGFQV